MLGARLDFWLFGNSCKFDLLLQFAWVGLPNRFSKRRSGLLAQSLGLNAAESIKKQTLKKRGLALVDCCPREKRVAYPTLAWQAVSRPLGCAFPTSARAAHGPQPTAQAGFLLRVVFIVWGWGQVRFRWRSADWPVVRQQPFMTYSNAELQSRN